MARLIPSFLPLFVLATFAPAAYAENASFTVEMELSGRRVEGTPLAWSKSDVFLLARDGHLLNFHPKEAKNFRKISEHFVSYTPIAMRSQLQEEFGRQFDVSSTGHYLVVHPRGERDTWAKRFEELYRSYMRYFTARGFEPTQPQFPLVAIVFPNQKEFRSYAQQSGAQLVDGTLGYYSPLTNRILLYDVTAGDPENPNWQVNAETIVHEAIHQMAFNTGVHSRYAMPPRWVAEGLGTLFEARGVSNSDRFANASERINRYRFEEFKKHAAERRGVDSLVEIITTDRMFRTNVEAAYGEAWALTFYLFETQARRYVGYLQKTASRPSFSDYTEAERLADFQEFFGKDLRQLEARYQRYLANLR
jgi:hypothetical protein